MLSFDIFSRVIYRVPTKSKYRSSISGQLKAYFGRSKGERAIAYALLEVTSPEAALTGNDVTWSHVTGSDVITGSMFCTCPKVHSRVFFLTIVVVQNVPLRMTRSSMANGCDMTGSHVTGSDGTWSDVIFPCSFLIIVLVLNVSLRMIWSSMATGFDVTESDVTGSDVIRPKMGDSPWGVILFVRGFV